MNKISFFFTALLFDAILLKNGIKIKKISTSQELNQIRHFVWRIYVVEKKYIDPNFFPKKIFEDEFDTHSTYFAAFNKKGRIIGSVRMVYNSSPGFPIEKLFTFSLPFFINRDKIAEISRLISCENVFKKGIVALELGKKCFQESLKNSIEYWYAFLPIKLKNYFEKYGIKFIELKSQPPTAQQQKNREPYRFYFEKLDPRPYLISIKEIPKNFKL